MRRSPASASPATCNPGGAGKWRDAFAEHLVGADVIVIPDNDKAGREHAQAVARSLAGKAARIRVARAARPADKGDVSDWFAAGGTVEAFNALVDQAPDWTDNGTRVRRAATQRPHPARHRIRRPEHEQPEGLARAPSSRHRRNQRLVWRTGLRQVGGDRGPRPARCGRPRLARAPSETMRGALCGARTRRRGARRAIAWGLEHGLSREQLPFKVIRGPLDFRDPQVAADIVATLEDLARRHGCEAGLIIVDTVSRALCGGDENCPKDMGALIANIGRIQSAIGVHIALTHHQPVDGKERMRGHGALLGAVDTTVHVVNKDGTRLAEVVKSSDHEEGQRIAFTLKSVIIDQDDGYGDPVTAPVVVEDQAPTTAKAAKRAVKIPKNATLALNALRDAVADCGQRAANAHVPAGMQVVTLDQWRNYAYRRGLGGEEAKSRQKAFTRAAECLAGSGLVGIWEPYAWPV